VARRRNEIGVRMALGAAAGDVAAIVMRDSLWMLCGGVLLGAPFAYVVGRLLQSSLFQLRPLDPVTAAAVAAVLFAAALLATWIPARRAASVDPVIALREE
jgi:ABC-type antimicrobial peptide transport system permease subunit